MKDDSCSDGLLGAPGNSGLEALDLARHGSRVGQLAEREQVVEAEAPSGLPLAVFVGAEEPSEGDVVADGPVVADLVLPGVSTSWWSRAHRRPVG